MQDIIKAPYAGKIFYFLIFNIVSLLVVTNLHNTGAAAPTHKQYMLPLKIRYSPLHLQLLTHDIVYKFVRF